MDTLRDQENLDGKFNDIVNKEFWNLIDEDSYIEELIKSQDPSRGGKLVKKTVVDKNGKKTTKWVKPSEANQTDKKHTQENTQEENNTNYIDNLPSDQKAKLELIKEMMDSGDMQTAKELAEKLPDETKSFIPKESWKELLSNKEEMKKSFFTKIKDSISNIVEKAKDTLHIGEQETKDYSDIILFNNKGEVLLLQRKDNSWWIPGGSIDLYDLNEQLAAERELLEETNNVVDYSLFIDKRETKENNGCIYTYAAIQKDNEIILNIEEHNNYKWCSVSELKNLDILFKQNDLLFKLCISAKGKLIKEILKEAFLNNRISENEFLNSLFNSRST